MIKVPRDFLPESTEVAVSIAGDRKVVIEAISVTEKLQHSRHVCVKAAEENCKDHIACTITYSHELSKSGVRDRSRFRVAQQIEMNFMMETGSMDLAVRCSGVQTWEVVASFSCSCSPISCIASRILSPYFPGKDVVRLVLLSSTSATGLVGDAEHSCS